MLLHKIKMRWLKAFNELNEDEVITETILIKLLAEETKINSLYVVETNNEKLSGEINDFFNFTESSSTIIC